MSRKRERESQTPYNNNNNNSRHFTKRRRPLPPLDDLPTEVKPSSSSSSGAVVITGLSSDCSVLDLKSRFEIYGAISRTRMDSGGVAYLTFRMKDSAQSAIDASLDPSFGITLNDNKVQVMWAYDVVPQWREGVKKKEVSPSSSKLLRPELPLSRHGRANKLGSAIVNPRDEKNNTDTAVNNENKSGRRVVNVPSRGREIVAYDDLL